jgi:hypothetical protein
VSARRSAQRHNATERRRVKTLHASFEALRAACDLPAGTRKKQILDHAAMLLQLLPAPLRLPD